MRPTEARLLAAFSLPGEPRAWARSRQHGKVHYLSKDELAVRQRIAWNYRQHARGHDPHPADCYRLEARFYLPGARRRDVDNMVKLILDALNRVAWHDDNQVVHIDASKVYVPEPGLVRTALAVWLLPERMPSESLCPGCGVPKSRRAARCRVCALAARRGTNDR